MKETLLVGYSRDSKEILGVEFDLREDTLKILPKSYKVEEEELVFLEEGEDLIYNVALFEFKSYGDLGDLAFITLKERQNTILEEEEIENFKEFFEKHKDYNIKNKDLLDTIEY